MKALSQHWIYNCVFNRIVITVASITQGYHKKFFLFQLFSRYHWASSLWLLYCTWNSPLTVCHVHSYFLYIFDHTLVKNFLRLATTLWCRERTYKDWAVGCKLSMNIHSAHYACSLLNRDSLLKLKVRHTEKVQSVAWSRNTERQQYIKKKKKRKS